MWRDLLGEVAQDSLSGARGITVSALSVVRAFVEQQTGDVSRAEVLEGLRLISRELLSAQPVMASLVNMLNGLWLAVEQEETVDVEGALRGLGRAAGDFERKQAGLAQRVADHTLPLLIPDVRVLTMSASSTVLAALLAAQREGLHPRVMALESRPMLEGRLLAEKLAANGIPVTLMVDAAMHAAVAEADVVLVGVDGMAPQGVVGKLGAASLALVAREAGVPLYALADRQKVWPVGVGAPVMRRRSPVEVWAEAPETVRVSNRYFDLTAWPLVAGVVTEAGVMEQDEILELGRGMLVHDEMASLYRKLTQALE